MEIAPQFAVTLIDQFFSSGQSTPSIQPIDT